MPVKLAIYRTLSLLAAPPGAYRVVPSLPLLDHRHYGGCLLARCRLHISLLVSLRRVGVAPSRGPLPRSCPLTWAPLPTAPGRSCALRGAALASLGRIGANAPRPPLTLRPKITLPRAGVFRPYRPPRCGSPSGSIWSASFPCARLPQNVFLCVRAAPCLLEGAKRPPFS